MAGSSGGGHVNLPWQLRREPGAAGEAPAERQAPAGTRLANALLAQLDHLGGVVLGDEARAGHDRAGRHDPVLSMSFLSSAIGR